MHAAALSELRELKSSGVLRYVSAQYFLGG